MSDLISRQAAIDTEGLDEEIRCEICRNPMHTSRGCDGNCTYDEKLYEKIMQILDRRIKQLPSAQPEQRWIPCSERLPDEHEWLGTKKFGTTISNEVYVTFEAPDGQRFAKHISFQNGKLSPVDEQRMKVWFKGAKPIAWMPLPEPYRGGDKE